MRIYMLYKSQDWDCYNLDDAEPFLNREDAERRMKEIYDSSENDDVQIYEYEVRE